MLSALARLPSNFGRGMVSVDTARGISSKAMLLCARVLLLPSNACPAGLPCLARCLHCVAHPIGPALDSAAGSPRAQALVPPQALTPSGPGTSAVAFSDQARSQPELLLRRGLTSAPRRACIVGRMAPPHGRGSGAARNFRSLRSMQRSLRSAVRDLVADRFAYASPASFLAADEAASEHRLRDEWGC